MLVESKVVEKLVESDYELVDGVKTTTWSGLGKRIRNLIVLQDQNRAKLEAHISFLGFDVVSHSRENDGWGDSLTIDKYVVRDRRATPFEKSKGRDTKVFYGNDDNSAIYVGYEDCGGRGLYSSVPDAVVWYKVGA